MSVLTPESIVSFHSLRFSHFDRRDLITVVRWDTDAGVVMDRMSYQMVMNLRNGNSLETAAKSSLMTVGEGRQLIMSLRQSGFVKSIDDTIILDTVTTIAPWFSNVPRGYFSWVLSPIVVLPAFLIMLIGLVLAFRYPTYFPTLLAFFWHENILVSIVGILVINYILLFVHETAHFITTRAVGGEAKIILDHQLSTVVVAAEEYHLAILPKYAKYVTYLSGLFVDIFSVAIVFIIYYLSDTYAFSLGVWQPLLALVVLIQLKAIVWEFGTFLTTDIYYFLNELSEDDDLKVNTKKYLLRSITHSPYLLMRRIRSVLSKTIFSAKKLAGAIQYRDMTLENRQNYRAYLIFSTIGFIATASIYFLITLPRYVIFTLLSVILLTTSAITHNVVGMITAVLTLLVVNEHSFTLAYLLIKERGK